MIARGRRNNRVGCQDKADALIRFGGSGVCHSDLLVMHEWAPENFPPVAQWSLPYTLEYENASWAAAHLTLLGVSEEVVMEDYLKSNYYIIRMYQKVIDEFLKAGGEKEIPLAILGVKKAYLEADFYEMRTKYGTIDKYFSDRLNIDAEKQKALRDLYFGKQ